MSVCLSPNWPNIFYAVSTRTEIETDFTSLVEDLKLNSVKIKFVVLLICALIYMGSFAILWERRATIHQNLKKFAKIVWNVSF